MPPQNFRVKMHLLHFFACLFALNMSVNCQLAEEDLPVFIIDDANALRISSIEANPFVKMPQARFDAIVHEAQKKSTVVIIFLEDSFYTEMFIVKDRKGSAFFHLQKGIVERKVTYLPLVSSPLSVLVQVFPQYELNVLFLRNSGYHLEDFGKNTGYFYVMFRDSPGNETVVETYRRHDLLIREVYYSVVAITKGPVIAFYTGMGRKHWETPKKYEMPDIPQKNDVTLVTGGGILRLVGVYMMTTSLRRAMFNQVPEVSDEVVSRRAMRTTLAYTDFELQFVFGFQKKSWTLDYVALLEGQEEVGRTPMGVGAPKGYNYVCGDPLVVSNNRDGSMVVISQYQLEPYSMGLSDEDGSEIDATFLRARRADMNKQFSNRTVNCGPYFSVTILSTLFVVGITLIALFVSVTMMINCNTPDKYDDPLGKTIIIADT